MSRIELLYFPGCPNVPVAREQLVRALETVRGAQGWNEIDVTSDDAPAHAQGYGSPTILVDGKDVTGAAPDGAASCRLYPDSEVRGAPPLEVIVAALRASPPPRERGRIATAFTTVPGMLFSVLPVVSCPSCWPAYAGVLGSLGVPFLMEASWLLPLTVGALGLALVGLGYHARRRRGFAPLVLGAVAAAIILLGKFEFQMNLAVYAGAGLLMIASAWNSWPRKQALRCEACTS